MTDVETRTKLNIWYQTLKEETAVSDASLFSFIFNCSLLQDDHFQILLSFGNMLLFFFSRGLMSPRASIYLHAIP